MAQNADKCLHRTAAILSIGDELALGETVDTNSAWIAQRLTLHGVKPITHVTVDDNLDSIVATMRELAARVDVVISSGGLGPTDDDLTRPALAKAIGDELIEDIDALAFLTKRFRAIGRDLLDANRVQTLRPASGRCLENDRGTAPGLAASLVKDGRSSEFYCLPGPPREMRPMFERSVLPALHPPQDRVVRLRTLHVFGMPESRIPELLGGLMERGRNPVVGTSAQTGYVTCKIRYEGDPTEADAALDGAEAQVRRALDPFVYGAGEETLAFAVSELLRSRGETVATAESCTGGLVAKMLTDLAGSSDIFVGGWATYSNEFKHGSLGVPLEVIEECGAVSEDVARAMAEGALTRSETFGRPATHSLAITGVAGPGGGTAKKPVGTVWIARATRGEDTEARLFRFSDQRDAIRERSALAALGMLRLRLIDRTDVKLLWEQ